MIATFERWTKGRSVQSLGTNWGSETLPFQGWRNFKEAYAPELVARAVRESHVPVRTCVDPFGGSGTTALSCQFLGVLPSTFEVNPYLADLIAAKLARYDTALLVEDFANVVRAARRRSPSARKLFKNAPRTFLEPGVNGRWIFDESVAIRIAAIIASIDEVERADHRRLFKVLLGGALIDVSNVVTSGKGRRYRRNWEDRPCNPQSVESLFAEAVESAIEEIHRYSHRRCTEATVVCGDARTGLAKMSGADLAIFSPPYPNSFDYTDVYNVELWTLGYLGSTRANHALRRSTLSSHVQISRDFTAAPTGSRTLGRTMKRLLNARRDLWNPNLPEMVGGYFADMQGILDSLKRLLPVGGSTWMIVGDSKYADIPIRTSEIIGELASLSGWSVQTIEPVRTMRSSAQQGGDFSLNEDLVVLLR